MALKGIEQTTQMSSHHSLPPSQGHHSHKGCVGNLSHGGGPSSPKPPHSHPAGWSLSCTSSVKPVSRFPPSLLLLSPYSMCILYSTSSRSIFPQTPKPSIVWGCEIHGQWPNHSLWPQPLPALTATWLSMLPLRLLQAVAVLFSHSPWTSDLEIVDSYLPLYCCISNILFPYSWGTRISRGLVSYILVTQSLNFLTSQNLFISYTPTPGLTITPPLKNII